jgi:diguanylate cyclase (GGDEF)-like protein
MTPISAPGDWTTHPALRVLAFAWVLPLAQSGNAASAWALCLAVGLVASRFAARPEADVPAAQALRELRPATRTPARRRTDATVSTKQQALSFVPLLKAHHDVLTGLATPQHLGDTGEPWAQDLQSRGLALCVMHVGLDSFEPVIERYGQEAGDLVLQQVAKRLRHLARDEDRVMRFDGAEFVLLLSCPMAESQGFSRSMATRITSELQRPLSYRTVSNLHIGCSVGSAVWPLDGGTLDDVISHASHALAAARSRRVPQAQTEAA